MTNPAVFFSHVLAQVFSPGDNESSVSRPKITKKTTFPVVLTYIHDASMEDCV